jgi:tetrahydromethanopterin S-methyltransferase subunit G
MAEAVTRDEFAQLAVRVDILQREVEGEKLVTRHILDQTRRNSDDLAAIKSRLDRFENKFEQRVDVLERKVDGLARDLPTIVADVMHEVLKERDERH